jgi:hypothetical protein
VGVILGFTVFLAKFQVIEYCEQHKGVPVLSNAEMEEESNEDSRLDYISEWDGQFLDQNVNRMFDLIEVRLRLFKKK